MVEAMTKSYTVTYEHDSTGWWVASVPEVPGCHTQGRTIRQARERIREALGLFVKNAAKAKLVDDVRLPADVRRLIDEQRTARERIERDQEHAQATLRRAAQRLAKLHVSVRDAGELLGLSHQRVQQLLPAR
jgi:predicted RNase H-like HicB family nuclease